MVALSSSRLLFLIAASFSLVLFVIAAFSSFGLTPQLFDQPMSGRRPLRYGSVAGRKLLQQGSGKSNSSSNSKDLNRMGEGCSPDDIVVYQGATTPLPNGIPTYTVQILNECSFDCSIGHIHLTCGWFSSARLVNPRLFRRLRFNDCLVNDGRPIPAGNSVSFQYANSFPYSLSLSSATCLRQ